MQKKIEVIFKLRFDINTNEYPDGIKLDEIVQNEMLISPFDFVTSAFYVKPVMVREIVKGKRVKKKRREN